MKNIRRQISACVLLAVFLPMLIFSSLHIHEIPQTTDTECSDCVHHNCHGHLSVMATWAHDCVLYQFLTLSMLTAVMMAVTVYVHVCKEYHAQPLCSKLTACCGAIVTRGPPSVWFSWFFYSLSAKLHISYFRSTKQKNNNFWLLFFALSSLSRNFASDKLNVSET